MAALVRDNKDLQLKILREPPCEPKTTLPPLLRAPLMHEGFCFTLNVFFEELHGRGIKTIAVTNGKDGVYVCDGSRILFHPSLAVPVVSTVGAGDAFGSGFVAWLIDGHSLEDSLRAGMINSASVIGSVGAKTGLLLKYDLEKRLNSIVKGLIEEHPLART